MGHAQTHWVRGPGSTTTAVWPVAERIGQVRCAGTWIQWRALWSLGRTIGLDWLGRLDPLAILPVGRGCEALCRLLTLPATNSSR